nr:hypothetical protein BaRGS_014002 [Batillaria attramentaria]
MRFCPFAQRARLTLAHKKIPYETVNISLKQKPEWFLERNPGGMVPVVEKDDKIVYESLIVADYLDNVYPDNRLVPADPYRKARDAMLIDYYGNKYISNYYKIVFSEGKDEEAAKVLNTALQKLDDELAKRGTKFFGGDQVAFIDYMLWPWLERVEVLTRCNPVVVVSATSFPRVHAWIQVMLTLPAVKECLFDVDTHMKFYKQHETVNVDLKPEKPEWFLERNPLGLVPTLEQDDRVVYESLITCDYLDDVYPNDRLTPPDPYRKARDAMLIDYYGGKFVPPLYKVLRSQGSDEEAKEVLRKALARLEAELGNRGKFFGGGQVAMVDYMLWPWFERLPILAKVFPDADLSETNFPQLFAWTQTMLATPAVQETLFDVDTHLKFMMSSQAGKPDYDIGLEP